MRPRALAESLFLILHDPFTGVAEVGREVVNCGLVAADMAQLAMAKRVGVAGGGLVVLDPASRNGAGDHDVGDHIVDDLLEEDASHDLRTWIELLGDVVFELHVRRLVDDAVVRREVRRTMFRRGRERFPAVDLMRATAPRVRLEHMLGHPEELDLDGAVLACIIDVLGFRRTIESEVDDALYEEIRENLPSVLGALMSGLSEAITAVGFASR